MTISAAAIALLPPRQKMMLEIARALVEMDAAGRKRFRGELDRHLREQAAELAAEKGAQQ